MRIRSNNKYLARLLAKLFGIDGYKIEFIFIEEKYDPELTELAFLRQSLDKFDEGVEMFRGKMQRAIEDAPQD